MLVGIAKARAEGKCGRDYIGGSPQGIAGPVRANGAGALC